MDSNGIKPESLDEEFIELLTRELTGCAVARSPESPRPQEEPPTELAPSIPLEPTTPLEPPSSKPVEADRAQPSLEDTIVPVEGEAGESPQVAPAPPGETTRPTASRGKAPPRAAGLGKGRWQIRILQPGKDDLIIPLSKVPITIGRAASCSVVLKCDRLSRKHARIWLDRMGPRVDDAGSSNGTLVNGTKVPAAYLQPEDEIVIGSISVRVEYIGP